MDWDLVIFDCDGVLVDSEPITVCVLSAMMAELGLRDTEEAWRQGFIGLAMPSWVHRIEERLGRPLPPEFPTVFYAQLDAAFRRELCAIPGVKDALDRIPVPVCVASNGNPVKIRTALALTDLLHYFHGYVFSAADVGRGKPYPDLFLHAARVMGATPERCAVVEDSPLGVQAARAAGMMVYGYAGHAPAAPLVAAGAQVFSSMTALPELLERPRRM